jgi:ribosomal protein L11 methylase PrmA
MKYIIGLTITSLLLLNSYAYSQRIYQWEEEGVDNYSNNPAEVPYDLIYDKGKDKTKSEAKDDQAIVKLSESLEGPSKEKLKLILEAETKMENLIASKQKELQNLKNQKDAPAEKVIELENFVFKAQHNLKLIRAEKTTFIKQNQNS